MTDFVNAITKPFSDMKSLGIGIVLGAIPIVNMLTINGFGLNCAKHAEKKTLPKWENIVDHITKSIMGAIASFVYLLPAIIVGAIFMATILMSVLTSATSGVTDPMALINSVLTGGIIGVILFVILALLAVFLIPLALTRYVLKDKFGEAFAFGKIIKRALTGEYIITWIVYIIYAIVLSVILSIISGILMMVPAIGFILGMLISGLGTYLIAVSGYTMFGQIKWKD
ncbi:MAG: DUF4013 domain-containing protein [Candidatus Micrarchaeia archaeon]|jgi:hypothetical protein